MSTKAAGAAAATAFSSAWWRLRDFKNNNNFSPLTVSVLAL
jgi:hypothetical protein